MRNPRLWRNVALGMVFLGAGALLAPFQLPTEVASDPVRTGLFAFGLTAVLFGFGAALFTQLDQRARQRLARGDTPGTPDFFHGRGDGSDPEDLSKCWSCGFSTHKFQSHCPRCGSTLQSRRWSRRFGVMLVLCGLFLTGLLSLVLYNITPLLLNPDVDMGGTRFGGSRGMGLGILAFLGVVWAFGAITLCYGIFQVATGKRSKSVAKVMVWIFTGFIALVGLMQLAESLGRQP